MKMKPGEGFGDTALMNDKPLTESILCRTDCHFATLSKAKYVEILKRIEMKTKGGWKQFYRSHPIFQKLTLVSLEKLFLVVELKMFTRNQTIFREGDEVKGFYLVYEGEASLSKKVKTQFQEKLDINKFYENKNKLQDNKDFKAVYHSTINDSKVVHKFETSHELRILGKGQFLGLEDALLKHSKNTVNHFTQTCVSKAAVTSVFLFDKNKCWEKLSYLGLMDDLNSLARKDFKRLKVFNKNSVKTGKRLFMCNKITHQSCERPALEESKERNTMSK